MKWLRVHEHGFDYCYLLPERGETDRLIVSAVAMASFNSAWPEGYGWEQWDPTMDVTTDNIRTVFSDIFMSLMPTKAVQIFDRLGTLIEPRPGAGGVGAVGAGWLTICSTGVVSR